MFGTAWKTFLEFPKTCLFSINFHFKYLTKKCFEISLFLTLSYCLIITIHKRSKIVSTKTYDIRFFCFSNCRVCQLSNKANVFFKLCFSRLRKVTLLPVLRWNNPRLSSTIRSVNNQTPRREA